MRVEAKWLSWVVLLAIWVQGCSSEVPTEQEYTKDERGHETSALSAGSRYIVKFRAGVSLGAANGVAALKAQGAQVLRELGPQNAVAVQASPSALKALRSNPDIEYIEEDPVRVPLAQSRPYGVDLVQAPLVWPSATGANRKICIIDSGLYIAHEDIQDGNVAGTSMAWGSSWNTDGCGHGTHVAGTIAALDNDSGVVGVLPNGVGLYIVKIFGDTCQASFGSSIVDALNTCKQNGAHVVSMSLGGQLSSETERQAFQQAWDQGVLVVAAAGNSGDTSFSYPASYPSVISVAAVDANKQVGSFSQKNNQVDVAAPGVAVLSSIPWQDNSKVRVDGQDYAAGGFDGSKRTDAVGVSGALVDGGLCNAVGSWSGKVVLCQRGSINFSDKAKNVQSGGGVAAIIYNNVPGSFAGGLGGVTVNIPVMSMSQEDGQALVATRLGTSATVVNQQVKPASGYGAWDGTSMATPHVSAVAALVWSANTSWTNAQLRQALEATAEDLGAPGRDDAFGHGLVRAKAALDYLNGGTQPSPVASFTSTCTGLSCAFTDTSTSPGGVVQWSWSFGDGGTSSVQHPSHAFAVAGTYTVALTISDGAGKTATTSRQVTVSTAPPAPAIQLSGEGFLFGGFLGMVDLWWTGATSTNVDVYRGTTRIASVPTSDGGYTDTLWFPMSSTYSYKICEAGSTTRCSNTAKVTLQQ